LLVQDVVLQDDVSSSLQCPASSPLSSEAVLSEFHRASVVDVIWRVFASILISTAGLVLLLQLPTLLWHGMYSDLVAWLKCSCNNGQVVDAASQSGSALMRRWRTALLTSVSFVTFMVGIVLIAEGIGAVADTFNVRSCQHPLCPILCFVEEQ
jgi:hypothetical protein